MYCFGGIILLVTMLGLVQGDGGAANRDGRVLLRYLQSGSLVWTWEDSGPAATFAPSAPKAAFSLAVHAATEKLACNVQEPPSPPMYGMQAMLSYYAYNCTPSDMVLAGIAQGFDAVIIGDEHEIVRADMVKLRPGILVTVPVIFLDTPTTWRIADLLNHRERTNVTIEVRPIISDDDQHSVAPTITNTGLGLLGLLIFLGVCQRVARLLRYHRHSAELVELHVVEDTRTEEESRVERAEARAALGTMPVSVYSFPEHANQCHDDCGTGSSSSDTHADTGHVFHLICIDPWVVQNRTCPLCKMDVVAYAVVNGLEPPPRPRSADTRPAPPLQDRTLSAADMLTQMRRYSTGGGHWDAEESSDPPPPPYEGVTPSAPAVSTANHRGAATADTRVSAASGKPDAETRRSASPPIYRRYAGTGQRELAQQPAQASTLRHPRPASTASSSASGRTVYLSFDESDGSTT